MFHYIKNIGLQALKQGLYSIDNSLKNDKMIKELGSTPFLFNNNNFIIEEIFTKYKNQYSNEIYYNV